MQPENHILILLYTLVAYNHCRWLLRIENLFVTFYMRCYAAHIERVEGSHRPRWAPIQITRRAGMGICV